MNGYEYLITSLALLGCSYASYTDLKEGKIYNICTFALIYGGVLVQIIYFLIGAISFSSALGAILAGGLISFLMYWLGTLAPGDAKLLWGISMMFPPALLHSSPGRIQFPPVVILMNTLFLFFWFALLYIFVKSSKEGRRKAFQMILSPKDLPRKLAQYVVNMFCFLAFTTCVYFAILYIFSVQLRGLPRLALVILLYYALNRLIQQHLPERRYIIYLLVFPPFLFLTLFATSVLPALLKSSLIVVGIYVLVNFFLRSFVLVLDSITLSRPVSIFDLKEGMILAERIVKVEGEDGIRYEKFSTLSQGHLDPNVLLSPTPDGISKEQIEKLKKLAEEGYFEPFENKVMVQRSFPFAPFILGGLILTILAKGPFYLVLSKLILRLS